MLEKDINETTRRNIERALGSDRFATLQRRLPKEKTIPKGREKDEQKRTLKKRRITLRIKINKKSNMLFRAPYYLYGGDLLNGNLH